MKTDTASALREILATEPVAFCEICGARIAWAESEEDRACSACWDELTPEERAQYELPREVLGAGKLRDKEEGGKRFTTFDPVGEEPLPDPKDACVMCQGTGEFCWKCQNLPEDCDCGNDRHWGPCEHCDGSGKEPPFDPNRYT